MVQLIEKSDLGILKYKVENEELGGENCSCVSWNDIVSFENWRVIAVFIAVRHRIYIAVLI